MRNRPAPEPRERGIIMGRTLIAGERAIRLRVVAVALVLLLLADCPTIRGPPHPKRVYARVSMSKSSYERGCMRSASYKRIPMCGKYDSWRFVLPVEAAAVGRSAVCTLRIEGWISC